VGTSSSEISRATISINQVSKNCQGLAGDRSELLKEQRVSIIYGDNDYLVDRKYSSINAQAYAELLGASVEKPFDTETLRGSNTRGRGTLFSSRASAEPLVSLIENAGLGHNWPAGQGGRGRSFVSKESIDYPYYLLSFFLSNSQR
jgi:poly(3-hydroxybutyrate) depolymerase